MNLLSLNRLSCCADSRLFLFFKIAFIEACDVQDFEMIIELLNNLASDATEVQELLEYANSDDNLFFIDS